MQPMRKKSAAEANWSGNCKSYTEYFANEENLKKFRHLLSHLELEEVTRENLSLGREAICYYGKWYIFANRAQLKEEIEKRGKVTEV